MANVSENGNTLYARTETVTREEFTPSYADADVWKHLPKSQEAVEFKVKALHAGMYKEMLDQGKQLLEPFTFSLSKLANSLSCGGLLYKAIFAECERRGLVTCIHWPVGFKNNGNGGGVYTVNVEGDLEHLEEAYRVAARNQAKRAEQGTVHKPCSPWKKTKSDIEEAEERIEEKVEAVERAYEKTRDEFLASLGIKREVQYTPVEYFTNPNLGPINVRDYEPKTREGRLAAAEYMNAANYADLERIYRITTFPALLTKYNELMIEHGRVVGERDKAQSDLRELVEGNTFYEKNAVSYEEKAILARKFLEEEIMPLLQDIAVRPTDPDATVFTSMLDLALTQAKISPDKRTRALVRCRELLSVLHKAVK